MKLLNPRSISGKLTRMNLMVSGTALLLAYVAFLIYDVYTLRSNLISSLDTESSMVEANSISALIFDDPQAATNTLSGLHGSPHILAAAILKAGDKPFATYERAGSGDGPIVPRLAPGQSQGYWQQGPKILFGRRIEFSGKPLGSVYLLAATTDISYRAVQFGFISAAILALCFLVALGATMNIRHVITDPLTNLADTAGIVTRKNDYSVRAQALATTDELGFLVRSFNQMLEQIQERDKALEESRSELEQRVQDRTAELLAANKELEAFSYSVAHDLRGPLQQIGNITFLLQQTSASEDEKGAGLIAMLFDCSRRMSRLIDDLLNLSRATTTPLRRTAVNLSSMSKSILDGLMTENGQRQVETHIAGGVHVIADEGLMRVVMENLLGNAWKYTSRTKDARIEFGFNEVDSEVVYFVRDNGVGFNPRYADRLFRPFQRLHSQGEFPGTGVGLATVQRIITRHGGLIWAKSDVNQGAEFFFTVPYESQS